MRFFKKRKEEKIAVPQGVGKRGNGFRRADDCFENSAFWCCITLLCTTYATLPFIPYEDGSYRAMSRDRILYDLIENPNPYMRHYDFMYVMGLNFELHGSAIAVIHRASNGIPIGLYPVATSCVYANWKDGDLVYTITGDNGTATYRREDLLIINNTPAGYDCVLSPLNYSESGLDLSKKAKQLQSDYYDGGSVLGKLIKVPDRIYNTQKEEIKSIFDSSRKYRNIVLPDNISVETIKADGESVSKLIEAQSWDGLEVSRRVRVPKCYLGDTSGGYGNMEQQSLQLVRDCLSPRCKAWEMAWKADVCGENEYVKFNLNSLMRADHSTRATWYREMLTHGVYSVNEVRALEDLEPIGKEGDVHYFQSGFADIKDIQKGAFVKDKPEEKYKEYIKTVSSIISARKEGFEKEMQIVSLMLGVNDEKWLFTYIENLKKRDIKNIEYESYRFINALLVKKYTENNIEYSVNGEKPSDGYFTYEGKKYRNPPFYEGDTSIVTEERNG